MSVFFKRRGEVVLTGKLASDYSVGESVFLNVNGVLKEFVIVHQGLPSNKYDSSCEGTWVIMKDLYEKRKFGGTNNDYQNSSIHTYLNNDFMNLLDLKVQRRIKSVKIPYVNGVGGSATVSGASGLSTKIFLPSGYEVGWTTSNTGSITAEGSALKYFNSDSTRVAYLNTTKTAWWLRTPVSGNTTEICTVNTAGGIGSGGYNTSQGVRPMFILPYTAVFDPNTNVIKG